MKNVLLVIIGAIFICSCNKEKLPEQFLSNDYIFEKDLEVCVIIPEVGCGECIAGGIYFLNKNKNEFSHKQNKNKVIFTAITTMKMLRRGLGDVNLDSLYYEIDRDNKYLLPEPVGLYPSIIYLDNGRIVKFEGQTPDNIDIFSELEDKFKSNED